MANWQLIISALIVASAFMYIGWRVYSQLRSLVNSTTKIQTPCASGCDKCLRSRDPKLKNNTLNTKVLIVLLVGAVLFPLKIVGQEAESKKDLSLTDRFENAIKAKEPVFRLTAKLVRNNPQERYALLGWQSGEDLVSTTTYELATQQEAAEMVRKTLDAPMSVPLQRIKLTQIGQEAYMSMSPYAKEGQTNLFFRKGKYFILMTASSPDLAKRFANHLADEIEN
jgi:hypothetical protein